MITITCKCGDTTITFPKLTEADFPNGWENECCTKVSKVVPIEHAVLAKVWDTPDEDVAWVDLAATMSHPSESAVTMDEWIDSIYSEGDDSAKTVEIRAESEAPKATKKNKAKAKE